MAAAGLGVGATCPLIAGLAVSQDGGDPLQVVRAGFDVKPQCADQCVAGIADLAQGNGRVFPPGVARFDEPRRDD